MTAAFKKITAALILIYSISGFFACSWRQLQPLQQSFQTLEQSFSINHIVSFRDIPGVTEEEINAIEKLQKEYESFTYGMILSTESFIKDNDENGEAVIGGYAALLCEWLSELFGIKFNVEIFPTNILYEELDNCKIDFSGLLAPTPERLLRYYMTDIIAERQFMIYRLEPPSGASRAGSRSLNEISQERPIKYAFTLNAPAEATVASVTMPGTYEPVWVENFDEAYRVLEDGYADAYIAASIADAFFIEYENMIVKDFFPLIFNSAAMTTANPELAPIISVVTKAQQNGAISYMNHLYNQGYNDYLKYKMSVWLNEEELEYIKNNPIVPITASSINYPLSFYNDYENKWQGVYFDLLDEINLLTGLSFEVVHDKNTNWADIYEILKNGKAAIVPEAVRTAEREEHLIWSDIKILDDYYALISRSDYRNITLNEISHEKIGIARDTVHAQIFKQWFPNHKNTVEYESITQAFNALQHGEVDLVMSTQRRLLYLTHYRELFGFKINKVFDQYIETRLAFNKDETILLSIVDKALKLINVKSIENDWMNRVYDYERALANKQSYFMSRVLWILVISFSFLILLLIALFILFRKNIKTQELLKKETITLNAVFNSLPDLVLCKDSSGKYTKVNNSFKMFTELDDNEILGKTASDIYIDNNNFINLTSEADNKVLNTASLLKFEDITYYRKDSQVFFDIIKTPLISGGKTIGLLGIMHDTTEKKQMMDTLKEREKMLATALNQMNEATKLKNNTLIAMENILNSIDAGIYVTVPETGELLFVNNFLKKSLNIEGDVIGKYCYKVFRNDLEKMCDFCPRFKLDKEPDKTIVWEEYAPNTGHTVLHSDCYIKWYDGRTVHLQHVIDITELVTAKNLAVQGNKAKSFFLAQMSHEIRTPINAILGISEIFIQDKNSLNEIFTGGAKEGFSKIYESGSLLTNIINDILDFSKIEAGKLEIIPKEYDIPIFINDTVQLNRIRYEGKPIEFNLLMDENMPQEAIGDEIRIRQILNNILSNAFKYTDTGKIELSISFEPGDSETIIFIFKVSDTGQGMNKDQLNRIFNEYERFNMETNQGINGTGLGMNITKRLVELMNGEIIIDSIVDKGSVFTVRIPHKKCTSLVCGKNVAESLQNFSFRNTSLTKNEKIIHEYMPDKKVLIVDDVESNLFVAKGLMLPYGLKIETAGNGFEAVEKIKNGNSYDIIFMDHMMPKLNGIDAVKILRDMGYIQPIVALTANAISGQEEVFLSNGFNDFLSKPIDSRELDLILIHFIRDKKIFSAKQKSDTNKKPQHISAGNNITKVEEYFAMDVKNTLNVLNELIPKLHDLNDEELELYIITVHGMKSALLNIGENKLADEALKLEQAGDKRDFAVITNETPAFIDELQSLLNIIKYLEKN